MLLAAVLRAMYVFFVVALRTVAAYCRCLLLYTVLYCSVRGRPLSLALLVDEDEDDVFDVSSSALC